MSGKWHAYKSIRLRADEVGHSSVFRVASDRLMAYMQGERSVIAEHMTMTDSALLSIHVQVGLPSEWRPIEVHIISVSEFGKRVDLRPSAIPLPREYRTVECVGEGCSVCDTATDFRHAVLEIRE